MLPELRKVLVGAALLSECDTMSSRAQQSTAVSPSTDALGWLGTEMVKSRFGDFECKNGYPHNCSLFTNLAPIGCFDLATVSFGDRGTSMTGRSYEIIYKPSHGTKVPRVCFRSNGVEHGPSNALFALRQENGTGPKRKRQDRTEMRILR